MKLEGFLCPECMAELSSPTELQEHWTKFHQENADNIEINKNETVCITVRISKVPNILQNRQILSQMAKILNKELKCTSNHLPAEYRGFNN